MELVFESEGPVLRNRLTKKKVKYYDRQNIRFVFRAEKIDFRDIPPDVTTFDRSPCTIYSFQRRGTFTGFVVVLQYHHEEPNLRWNI